MGIFFGDNPDSCFNCKHYSGLFGDCTKGKRTGSVLQTNICPLYENTYKAREQERRERAEREERERLQRENERLSQEAAASSYSPPPSYSSYESYGDSLGYDEESPEEGLVALLSEREESLEEAQEAYRDAPETIKDAVNEAIRVIKGLRQADWEDAIVDNSSLKELVECATKMHRSFESADLDLFDSDFKKEFRQLKKKVGTQFTRLNDVLVEEINWHFDGGHFNIAFALAECFNLFETEAALDLYKKCKAKHLETTLAKAKALIASKQYDDAIDYLKPFEEEKAAKPLLHKCYEGLEGPIIENAKALMAQGDYQGAIDLLTKIEHLDVIDQIEECKKHLADSVIEEANRLISDHLYDEAIEVLKTVKSKEAAPLMKKAREEKREYCFSESKRLASCGDYDGAIRLLKQLGSEEALKLAETYRIGKAISLYQKGRAFEALDELKTIKGTEATSLASKIRSNMRKKKTAKAGIILLSIGLVLFVIAIIVTVSGNIATDNPNLSWNETKRLISQYTVWEVILYFFSVPISIVGLILTIVGFRKYKIERL